MIYDYEERILSGEEKVEWITDKPLKLHIATSGSIKIITKGLQDDIIFTTIFNKYGDNIDIKLKIYDRLYIENRERFTFSVYLSIRK